MVEDFQVDLLSSVFHGFAVALDPTNLLFCLVGCVAGTLIGVLPGLGPLAAIAFLLPTTFHVPVIPALIMLAGIYYGAMYGGSTTSILVNIPGEAASVVTCLDGYQMARRGRAGAALGISAMASFIAGTLGVAILMALAPPLAKLALKFGPAEYTSLLLLALVIVSFIGGGEPLKAMTMGVLGLAIGMIGTDMVSGNPRFTFGVFELQDGVGIVPVAIGVFGIAEVFANVEIIEVRQLLKTSFKNLWPTIRDYRDSAWPIIRGSLMGFFVGVLPGGNPIIASVVSYGVEKKMAKNPERFGHGAIEGVAGPEAANNAATSGAFVPLLSLGVPNNAVMALMLGAMVIHGVVPGPGMIGEKPDLFWGIVCSMYVGNAMLLALNLPLVGLWVQVLRVPYRVLMPLILIFCVIGVYAVNSSIFETALVVVFGVFGFLMRKLGYDQAPLIMGVILGPMLENNFRQALLLSRGSFAIFVGSPISSGLLAIVAIFLGRSLYLSLVKRSGRSGNAHGRSGQSESTGKERS